MEAAYTILAESGLAKFSIASVASRTGVARTTIHRWWPTKGVLAIESFVQHILHSVDFETTGSGATDLRRLLEQSARSLSGRDGTVISSIIAEGQRDEETLRAFMHTYFRPVREKGIELVRQAVNRKDFREDVDAEVLLDSGVGAIYARLLLRQPITAAWTETLVRQLLNGAVHKSGSKTPRATSQ